MSEEKTAPKTKLGCNGCPLCGSGSCYEIGLPENCTQYVREREIAQMRKSKQERILDRDRASGYGQKYSRMKRLPRWAKV